MGEYIGLGQAPGASAWLIPEADGSLTWGTSSAFAGQAIEVWVSTNGGDWTLVAQNDAATSNSQHLPWIQPGNVYMFELRAHVPGQPATMGVPASVMLDLRTSPPTTTGTSTSAPPGKPSWWAQPLLPDLLGPDSGVTNLHGVIAGGGLLGLLVATQKR